MMAETMDGAKKGGRSRTPSPTLSFLPSNNRQKKGKKQQPDGSTSHVVPEPPRDVPNDTVPPPLLGSTTRDGIPVDRSGAEVGAYAVQTVRGVHGHQPTAPQTGHDHPMVEAELAPDVAALEAENNTLRDRLQRMEQQQQQQEQPQEVIVAEAVSKTESQVNTKWKKGVGLLAFLAFVLGLIVVMVVVLTTDSKNDGGSKAQVGQTEGSDDESMVLASEPEDYYAEIDASTKRFQKLQALLEPIYGIDALERDPSRLMALHWLANQDKAGLDFDFDPYKNTSSLEFALLQERYVVVLFYFCTGGPQQWTKRTNWLSSASICRWENVHCDPTELLRVDELSMGDSNLKGTIPEEIAGLEELKRCDLGYNHQLTGTIPTEFGQLTLLEDLSLGGRLTGTLPAELGNLSNLWFFGLTGNGLTGTIPTEYGRLSSLEFFYLGHNQLTGTIPSQLANLPLKVFYFDNNNLEGNVDAIVCNASNPSLPLADAGGDCMLDVTCSCCAFCCNGTHCCDGSGVDNCNPIT